MSTVTVIHRPTRATCNLRGLRIGVTMQTNMQTSAYLNLNPEDLQTHLSPRPLTVMEQRGKDRVPVLVPNYLAVH